MMFRLPIWLVMAVLTVSGCSASGQRDAAGEAAVRFVSLVTTDPAGACQLLAPETRQELEDESDTSCEKALPELKLPAAGEVHRVEVAGHSAQVRTGDQTLFLALFDQGWRVTAAGCERAEQDQARPYTCSLKGA